MNLIYSSFLINYVNNNIFLTDEEAQAAGKEKADTFKIALLNSTYEVAIDDARPFSQLQLAGCEIEGTGYTAGGQSISFIFEGSQGVLDNQVHYRCAEGMIKWGISEIAPASFTARSAIIYRVSDGALVSWYDFGEEKTVESGEFVLDWDDVHLISILLDVYNGADSRIKVIDYMSNTSTSPVTARALAAALAKLGVRLEREEIDDAIAFDPDTHEDRVDAVEHIDNSSIDALFNFNENSEENVVEEPEPEPEPTPEPEPEPEPNPDPENQENENPGAIDLSFTVGGGA